MNNKYNTFSTIRPDWFDQTIIQNTQIKYILINKDVPTYLVQWKWISLCIKIEEEKMKKQKQGSWRCFSKKKKKKAVRDGF